MSKSPLAVRRVSEGTTHTSTRSTAMPRRIVVTEFVSLDGVMEAPGGDDGFVRGAWTFDFPDEARFKYKVDELMEHDALLLGRRTYQGFAAAWPERDGEFADR